MKVQTLKQQLSEGKPMVLVDVRDAQEVTKQPYFVHPPKNYVHVPIMPLLFATREELEQKIFGAAGFPVTTPVVTLCHSGGRSARACEKLLQYGWHAENLEGGVEAWGQPV
jgi:rhodanese-related sulfurtransferase